MQQYAQVTARKAAGRGELLFWRIAVPRDARYGAVKPYYRLAPAPFPLAPSGRLVVLSAHSHSESQVLPHLPKHSKSIM